MLTLMTPSHLSHDAKVHGPACYCKCETVHPAPASVRRPAFVGAPLVVSSPTLHAVEVGR